MAFTDHCDIFVSVHENGVNKVVRHVLRQRPSLFNYATEQVANNPELWCAPIDPHPHVVARANPLFTIEDPLPIIGTDGTFGLNFVAQFTKLEVDFFPGNSVPLPPELNPLAGQRFAVRGQICAGIGCPPKGFFDEYRAVLEQQAERERAVAAQFPTYDRPVEGRANTGLMVPGKRVPARPTVKRPPVAIPTREMNCFCLDLYVVGHIESRTVGGKHVLAGRVDGLEIVDLKPVGLENSIECYAMSVIQLALVPKAKIAIQKMALGLANLATVTVGPTPISAAVPNNPAIEQDQTKVFINLTASPPPPPEPPGPPGPTPPTRNINWSSPFPPTVAGPSHLVVAAAEKGIEALWNEVRDNFKQEASDSVDLGPFTAGYEFGFHLAGGDLDLRNDGTIRIEELDIKVDKLKLSLGFDIPEICIGGFCLIPTPWGCAVEVPGFCVFEDDPDVELTLDLSGVFTSEITATARPNLRYGVETTRPAGMSDLDARDAGIPNAWGIFMKIEDMDFDLFDFSDMAGDILMNAATAAVNGLLPGPQWMKDIILAIIGSVVDVVRLILDIGDDIDEWLSDLLGVSLGLGDLILTLIGNYLLDGKPLAQIEDPFPAADYNGPLVPILLPIRNLSLTINDKELVVQGSVGD